MAMTTKRAAISPPRGFNHDPKARAEIFGRILDEYCNANGRPNLAQAFNDHPNWAVQVGWGNEFFKSRGYAQLAYVRKQRIKANGNGSENGNGNRAHKYPKSRHQWTEEQVSLARQIEKDPTFRNGQGVNWSVAMAAHPEWAETLCFRKKKAFMAFLGRLRGKPHWKGAPVNARKENKATALAVVVPPLGSQVLTRTTPGLVVVGLQDVIEIEGRGQFAIRDVIKRLEEFTAKLCPECGLNVQMFNTAFNVARRHSAHLLQNT